MVSKNKEVKEILNEYNEAILKFYPENKKLFLKVEII